MTFCDAVALEEDSAFADSTAGVLVARETERC
jgi:hypothetical protein